MFLRNGWYTALWSHELTDKPVGKTLLNEKVVLFRNGKRFNGKWSRASETAPTKFTDLDGNVLGLIQDK